ncbi:Hypothetical protein NTJ_06866 [Nesidiocoris tenuis]|uniref:Uncharacterized protein n=1 Tax=Nesidiocoris tenuis TaxID=355587 RepID=A0ABN7APB2_9HEMI|nr:Hypothetical protein NTJ_06861 [Nesidiocoris tenuis]BES94056.1 Hypothetical protein NTJ_06866 [Nesidiocoris tenuis]
MQLVENIDRIRSVHAKATAEAEKKICLWYLSEEKIALALFDEVRPAKEREGLVHSIQHKIDAEDPMKKRVMPFQQLKVTPISNLGTVKTARFFKIFGFDDDFGSHPVESWSENPNYRRCKQAVDGLNVVNDHAERSIKLIQDYNRLLTTKEAAFQNILLTVAEHKKTLPNVKKSTLAKKYSKYFNLS